MPDIERIIDAIARTDVETRLEERAAELHATDRARLEALAEVERLTAALGEARDALRRTNARPYLLTAQAWSTEDGDLCVLGTHVSREAHKAALRHLADVADDYGDVEWGEWARNINTVNGAERLYVDPLVVEDEVWPREATSPQPRPGWLPYLFARYP